jgi:membrane peptidoglycan carboxypeptidase
VDLVNLFTSWIVAARRLLTLVVVSCLAGLVAAGLVAPVVAGLGVGARDGAEAFTEMPEELEIQPLAERSRMTDADGNTLAVFFEENRIEVPLDKISQEMQDAILAIEDHRFYEHGPLDIQGASRAFVGNLQAGETTSGGSTLTQQYVKLLLLDQAESADERAETLADSGPQGYFRKLRELRVALGVEQRMTKDEILAAYLNIANFGGPSGRSNYGIEAAARYYFSTSAEELTLPQAAMLAGLVQRPSEYYPVDNPEAAIGRRNTVITRMAELGMISEHEASEARQADLGLDVTESPSGCISSWAPWFCDYAVNEILGMEGAGELAGIRTRGQGPLDDQLRCRQGDAQLQWHPGRLGVQAVRARCRAEPGAGA